MICKVNGMGNNHWPDRLVLVPGGVVLLIEFKRPGETLRPAQELWHKDAQRIGHTPYVYDNWREPLELVRRAMDGFRPPPPKRNQWEARRETICSIVEVLYGRIRVGFPATGRDRDAINRLHELTTGCHEPPAVEE